MALGRDRGMVVGLLAGPAAAEETTCRGTLGRVTVDNLRVPQGSTCILNGTFVKGTVKVERDATLRATGVRVIGNVQGENAAAVSVAGGSTVGAVCRSSRAASVTDSRVTGDILYDENRSALQADRNLVGGNVQAFKYTGGVAISGNRIDGNLQCKENVPPPTSDGSRARNARRASWWPTRARWSPAYCRWPAAAPAARRHGRAWPPGTSSSHAAATPSPWPS